MTMGERVPQQGSVRARIGEFLDKMSRRREEQGRYREVMRKNRKRSRELKKQPIHAEGMDTTGAGLGI